MAYLKCLKCGNYCVGLIKVKGKWIYTKCKVCGYQRKEGE